MAEPHHTEKSIFLEAIEIDSMAARAAFLEQECADNQPLRAEVEALLKAHEKPQRLLDAPMALAPTIDEPMNERPGTVIGPYKLMEQIGEGGMGLVFVAEQQHPIRRKVALKVIKPGMDTRQVIARFEAERQALALMDHPNIAKVLDGGTTASGRPYFVMELVKGVPITEYADQNQVPLRERLELFLSVCQAVHHAHQKGIIHRDLKPSNVLVSRHDVTPLVKVIDFGVAKALGQELTDKTLFTGISQMIGTPLYMSPEQAGMSDLDIDTRSDIYSLGVLLYELLTGTTPFDKNRLRDASYDEIRRIIREEEPPKPSTRISTLVQGTTTVGTNRKSDPRQLSRLVRGELDWMVMKALEKDRNRRYETANSLAMDVQRYLADEPVLACPPSAWYRFRKFARRNKARLAVAGCLLLVLTVLGASLDWILRDQAAQRAETEGAGTEGLNRVQELQDQARWAEALVAARQVEELLAGRSHLGELPQRLRQRLAELKMAARLEEGRLLTSAATSAKACALDTEGAEAEYASAFREYGLDVDALAEDEAADAIRAQSICLRLAAALDDWARMRRLLRGQGDATWKHLLAIARAADPDPWRNQVRDAWEQNDREALLAMAASGQARDLPPTAVDLLAWRLRDAGGLNEAVAMLRQAQRRHPADFAINFDLGYCLIAEVKPPRSEEGIRYLTAALALRPRSPAIYLILGVAYDQNGMHDDAIEAERQAIHLKPNYAVAHNNLGNSLADKGRLDEAITAYRESIRLRNDSGTHHNLGIVLKNQGKLDEAIAEYREALRLQPDYAAYHNNLGIALFQQRKLEEAIAEWRKAIELDPNYALPHDNLGTALAQQGRIDDAIKEHRQAIPLDPKDALLHYNLGIVFKNQGKLDEAIAEYRQAIELDPNDARPHNNLGLTLTHMGQVEEGIAEYRRAIRLNSVEAHHNLGVALFKKGKLDEEIACYRKAIALDPKMAPPHNNLGVALRTKGQFEEAIAEFREALRLKKDEALFQNNLRNAEQLAVLAKRLPAVRKGDDHPKDAAERISFAQLCQLYRKEYVTADRFYEAAFAAEPKQIAPHRYNAACAAALASCGEGKDADQLDDKERRRLRRQALDWLRAELDANRLLLEKDRKNAGAGVAEMMRHWLDDPDFAGVRGLEALAKLPEADRQPWQKLWYDVADMLQRAQEKK
jgi:serine/threonine-protein kinase